MKIWFINADCGDGSSRTEFYDSQECVDFCCDEDNGLEEYWDGDGGSYGSMNIDCGDVTPVITGITIRTMADLQSEAAE